MNRIVRIALPAAVAVAFTACTSGGGRPAPDAYLVTGELPVAPGETVSLNRVTFPVPDRNEVRRMDTTRADAQSRFRLEGALARPTVATLTAGAVQVHLVLEPGALLEVVLEEGRPVVFGPDGARGANTLNELATRVREEEDRLRRLGREVQRLQAAGEVAAYDSLRAIKDSAALALRADLRDAVDTASHPLVRFYAAECLPWETEFEFIRLFSNRMMARYGDSPYTKDLVAKVGLYEEELRRRTAEMLVGRPAPELEGPGPDGGRHRLSDLRGQLVLVDFWASWCKPCRRENPNVVDVWARYRDRGFTVFSVSLDRAPEPWKQAIEADGLDWPHHVGDMAYFASPLATAYGVTAIPAGFLVGPDGTVLVQGNAVRGPGLEKSVREFLGEG